MLLNSTIVLSLGLTGILLTLQKRGRTLLQLISQGESFRRQFHHIVVLKRGLRVLQNLFLWICCHCSRQVAPWFQHPKQLANLGLLLCFGELCELEMKPIVDVRLLFARVDWCFWRKFIFFIFFLSLFTQLWLLLNKILSDIAHLNLILSFIAWRILSKHQRRPNFALKKAFRREGAFSVDLHCLLRLKV